MPPTRSYDQEPEEEKPSYMRPLPLWTQVFRFLTLFLGSVMFLAAALLITNARMPDPRLVRPLPDILFEIIPKWAWMESLTDVGIFFLNASTVVVMWKVFLLERHERRLDSLRLPFNVPYIGAFLHRVIFGIVDSGLRPHPLRFAYLIAAIRFLTVYFVMMVYRAFVITMTSYPATDNHCQHPQVIEHPIRNMILTLVTLGSGAIHCGDLMFSGHTIILSLGFLLLWEYGTYIHRFALRVWGSVVILVSFFSIIASRSHYTDDILVAAYATVTTYMVLRHHPDGAPWQLQLLIRWWPCCGSNHRSPAEADDAHGGAAAEVIVADLNEENADAAADGAADADSHRGAATTAVSIGEPPKSPRSSSPRGDGSHEHILQNPTNGSGVTSRKPNAENTKSWS